MADRLYESDFCMHGKLFAKGCAEGCVIPPEKPPTTHELKTWPIYFNHLVAEEKTFEVRNNDRNFRQGDILVLREWDHENPRYTGRELRYQVGYIYSGPHVTPGYVVMGLLGAALRGNK